LFRQWEKESLFKLVSAATRYGKLIHSKQSKYLVFINGGEQEVTGRGIVTRMELDPQG